jgi:hypothetical protein
MIKRFVMGLVTIVLAQYMYASPITDELKQVIPTLNDDTALMVTSDLGLKVMSNQTGQLQYFPGAPALQPLKQKLLGMSTKSNVESVYYIEVEGKVDTLALYNNLLKVSSLKGLQFYSRSEKKVKTLINNCWVIDGANSIQNLPDLQVNRISEPTDFFMYQDEETFGKNNYQVQTFVDIKTGWQVLAIANTTPLKKGIITMAQPDEMQLYLCVLPMKSGFLFYGLTATKEAPPSFVRKNAEESLQNRLAAFKEWVTTSVSQSLQS